MIALEIYKKFAGGVVLLAVIFGAGYASIANGLPTPICIGASCGFGGVIVEVEDCTCIPLTKVGAPTDVWAGPATTYGKYIKVSPPKGGELFVVDGLVAQLVQFLSLGNINIKTTVYDYNELKENHWVLGLDLQIPPIAIPCHQLDEVKTVLCGILAPIGLCKPKIICTDSKGEGWYVKKIGTSGAPASQQVIDNLLKLKSLIP